MYTQADRIPCSEARRLVETGAQLIDVRSPQEHAQGALPGSVNVPLQILQAGLHQLDNHRPVIVYCATGMRSAQAACVLGACGFDTVHDLGSWKNLLACQ